MEFILDTRSGIPVYRQIIQQVEYNMSIGKLGAGDKLPTVRSLAVDLKINPNTVAKAYNELDIDPNCPKLPFAVYDNITGNGYILEEDLSKLVVKAKTLLNSSLMESKSPEKFNHSPDFRTVTATVSFKLTEDQANCIQYLRQQKQRGIYEVNGEEIMQNTGKIYHF